MSKSLWNGIDPIDMIDKYGTDALRLTLSIWNTPWNDLKFDEENIKNNMIFINKLWNASRFVNVNLASTTWIKCWDMVDIENNLLKNYDNLMFHEKWILSRIRYLSDLVTESMENYNFSEAWLELQNFTKHEFCDYYIEEFKLTKDKSEFWFNIITYVLNNLLKLWHPYIPFVSEEIYNKLWFGEFLIDALWWKVKVQRNEEIEKNNKLIIDIIREIRNLRAENNILPNKTIWLSIYARNKNYEIIKDVLDIIWWIVKTEYINLVDVKPKDQNLAYCVIKSWVEVFVDTKNAIDVEKEIDRLNEQITDTKEYIAILDKKLLNENFVRNAPESLVREEMSKKELAKDKLIKLEEKVESFQ